MSTPDEINAIIIAERVSSALSVTGAAFIITTFLTNRKFRKPINRLVFYACFGNLITNIATLISITGIEAGATSCLCQFQGFLIQWFMPADACWTFVMACNVYLTFFHQYDAASLRTLEIRYLILCYGIPAIPAIVYFFPSTPSRGRIYGPATLWCWVTTEWNALRVATFYGPVWIIILIIVGIYIRVGAVVFKWRRHLISLDRSEAQKSSFALQSINSPTSAGPTPASEIRRTYEFTVTSQVPHESHLRRQISLPRTTVNRESFPAVQSANNQHRESKLQMLQTANLTVHAQPRSRTVEANRATINYCKCALLFFIALICTWVPSTVNRVYTLVHPNPIFGLDFTSGLVLPLQGFWNTIIYIVTSFPACRELFHNVTERIMRFCYCLPQSQISASMRQEGRTLDSGNDEAGRSTTASDEKNEYRKYQRNYNMHSLGSPTTVDEENLNDEHEVVHAR